MPLDEFAYRATASKLGHGAQATRGRGVSHLEKFVDPVLTAKGEPRGRVPFTGYRTVWFNTGTLCNIACHNCYIESSPRNDRLVYLSREEVRTFLDEAVRLAGADLEIGFTGGEPFMNPDFLGMLEDSLALGARVLILTNAMRPMQRHKTQLLALKQSYPGRINIRVSIDHFEQSGHEQIRGERTWHATIEGLRWLSAYGFDLAVAGRLIWDLSESNLRVGYTALFANEGVNIDARDPARLILFPEMNEDDEVPEISHSCWSVLGKSPTDVMCSSSRMVVKRRGAEAPVVVACTLLPYSEGFEMGHSLGDARKSVSLNHRNCARFCVLGGASCSAQK